MYVVSVQVSFAIAACDSAKERILLQGELAWEMLRRKSACTCLPDESNLRPRCILQYTMPFLIGDE